MNNLEIESPVPWNWKHFIEYVCKRIGNNDKANLQYIHLKNIRKYSSISLNEFLDACVFLADDETGLTEIVINKIDDEREIELDKHVIERLAERTPFL